ncbi:MAG TPA: M67 family metallopeptidase [Longilinea sp.]|nr:M67 family metallopeptidase [Longilinea sp.]
MGRTGRDDGSRLAGGFVHPLLIMVSRSLSLTIDQRNTILAWVQAHLPEEACGMLGGCNGIIQHIIPITNVAHSPIEFSMDGLEQLNAMQTLEAQGLEITAIFHSHPNGPILPSDRDIATYYYPDSVMLIAAPTPSGWDLFAYRIKGRKAFQIPIKSTPGVTPPTASC